MVGVCVCAHSLSKLLISAQTFVTSLRKHCRLHGAWCSTSTQTRPAVSIQLMCVRDGIWRYRGTLVCMRVCAQLCIGQKAHLWVRLGFFFFYIFFLLPYVKPFSLPSRESNRLTAANQVGNRTSCKTAVRILTQMKTSSRWTLSQLATPLMLRVFGFIRKHGVMLIQSGLLTRFLPDFLFEKEIHQHMKQFHSKE